MSGVFSLLKISQKRLAFFFFSFYIFEEKSLNSSKESP